MGRTNFNMSASLSKIISSALGLTLTNQCLTFGLKAIVNTGSGASYDPLHVESNLRANPLYKIQILI